MNIIIESHLKSVREAKGISVRELARLTNMSKTNLSNIENNHKIPNLYTLCLIAAVLSVPPEALYSYKVIK